MSYDPTSPERCLLDAGDPNSPWQDFMFGDQQVVREIPMDSLTAVDRKVLASLILGVDITEVFSPKRVNELASKFGLTPGSSLDLTNRLLSLVRHPVLCSVTYNSLTYTYIVKILSG